MKNKLALGTWNLFVIWCLGFGVCYAASKYTVDASQKSKWTNGLVGYWTFDGPDTNWTSATTGTTNDVSGNGNTGTLTNMSRSTSPASGKVGQALSFDGVDDYVDAGTDPSINNLSSLTYSFWVYKNMNDVQTSLISQHNKYSAGGKNLDTTASDYAEANSLRFRVDRANVNAELRSVANSLPAFGWYFVAATYNETDGPRIYVNGAEVSYTLKIVGDGSTLSEGASTPLLIGTAYPEATTQLFNGKIDEVRIYNRALAPAEIQEMYNAGAGRHAKVDASEKNKLTSGLAGYWTFDGPDTSWSSATTGTTNDVSGNGNTGTLTNMNRSTSPVRGKVGQALSFDGVDDYVLTTSTALNGVSAFTVSFWEKPTAFTGDGEFDATEVHNGVGRTSFGTQGLTYNGYSNTFAATIQMDAGTNCVGTVAQSGYSTGQWYHYVAVYDGTQTDNATRLKIYINGVSKTLVFDLTVPATTYDPGSSATVNFGTTNGGYSYSNGLIDEVRIYNRALSPTEIQELYSMGQRNFRP